MKTVNSETVDLGNCLVIGGNGQIGRAIVHQLVQKGTFVRVLDLNKYDDIASVEVIVGDLCDPAILSTACKNIDTIFHTASVVYDPTLPSSLFYRVNVEGNRNVLTIAKAAKIKTRTQKTGFLVQGRDRKGAVAGVLRKLAEQKINVTAIDAVSAGAGRYAAILWVKPKDINKTAKALGAK